MGEVRRNLTASAMEDAFRRGGGSVMEASPAHTRLRPQGLELLCRRTRFSRHEIQRMYRGFKQECPSGAVSEETFRHIYSQFFPLGNASRYAHYVFKALDLSKSGLISFQDLLLGLSALARGTPYDKLRWAFVLYDLNGDGRVTKREMGQVVSAVYELIQYRCEITGQPTTPAPSDTRAIQQHVDRIFKKLDSTGDGVLTADKFVTACLQDESIARSLEQLDTVL